MKNILTLLTMVLCISTYAQAPSEAAPDPTCPSADVISMFSNTYADVAVDTWRTPWTPSSTTLTDLQVSGNDTKLYEQLGFVGVETISSTIDASNMTHFNVDIWTPDMTQFKVKLVDFGPNNIFQGSPNDDSEHEYTVVSPALNEWVTLSIPLADFTNLNSTSNLAQYIFESVPFGSGTLYIDNVYFSNNCNDAPTSPQVSAPDPTCPSADVISMFSNAYTDVVVDTWRTPWTHPTTTLTDLQIAGDDTKLYELLGFVGVETTSTTIDATGMTHFNIDIWTPDMTEFKIKLVDFGANDIFQGMPNDDSEHLYTVVNPTLNEWVTLSIPLADFTNLASTSNLAQYVIESVPFGAGTLYIDNVYFSNNCTAVPTSPQLAAPDPTCPSGDVISLFSDAYADVSVDTWRTPWTFAATALTDLQIAGNAAKLYELLGFVGVETINSTVDASAMTHFNIDIWTPDMTEFKIKLVDFGANDSYQGMPNDDTEHEITIANPTLNEWVTLSVPLTDFINLTSTSNLAQYIFSSVPFGSGTVYIDNVYFSNNCTESEPLSAAPPAPNCDEANVVSLFSNDFTDVPIDTWRTDWSSGDLEDIQLNGDDTKKYTNVDFVGVEFLNNQIDASGLTHFRMDFWSPNMTQLRIKLVDFGANGIFQGSPNDDSEHEIILANPGLNEWVSLDIPLSDFPGLNSTSNLAQLVLSGMPAGEGVLYVDNVYFRGDCNPTPPCPVLVWSDEFDGTTLDLTKWTPQIGDGCPDLCGWGNSELEYYRAENAVVSGGTLKIIAKEENFGGKNYTSARLRTKDKADFTYGRFEASIKMPIGQGIWPAFWMLSTDEPYGGWPQSGEIDVVELLGQEPDLIHGTMHYGPAWPNNQSTGATYRLATGTFNDDFHEYAIEWDEQEIRWYLDDILYSTKTTADTDPYNWPYDHDFHMLLNMAVGGNWPGSPDASTMFPQTMEIDYVRVYEGEFASIAGSQEVDFMSQGEVYTIANAGAGATYIWTVPAGATIVSGQGTDSIVVDWADENSSGTITVVVNGCASESFELDVVVLPEIVDVLDCVLENFDEEAMISYQASTGTMAQDLANPSPDMVNSSALVGQYTRSSSEQYDNITYAIDVPFAVGNFVTAVNKFYVDIYTAAPVGTTVILQLEDSNSAIPSNYPTGRHSRYQIVTTTQNEWETLAFDYLDRPDASVPDVNVDQIIILFEPNSFTGDMYYFDNLEKHCFATPALISVNTTRCPGADITVDVSPAGMTSYTFFIDANLNGSIDNGEEVQSGANSQYISNSFADGDVIGVLVENSEGCEQTITTTISFVIEGGDLSGGPFEFCVGDGNADIITSADLSLTGNVGTNSAWVITDNQLTILSIANALEDIDFEGATEGTCLIWHLSYEDDLTGAAVGMNAANLGGCFSLSNSIEVLRNEVHGGTLNGEPFQFCVDDGNSDVVMTDEVRLMGNVGENSAWVITDDQLTILGLPNSLEQIDFEGTGEGTCLIWHLSFEGDLIGAEEGKNAADLRGCFSLSNPVEVVRELCGGCNADGGTLLGGPFEFCVSDGNPDFIMSDDLTLSGNVGSNSAWVITDDQLNILDLPNSPEEVDFEGAGTGTCLIWHLSYEDDLTGAEVGMNAENLGGCFSLSNSISVTRNGVNGGTLTGGPFEFCVSDGTPDNIPIDEIILTGNNANGESVWLLTDEEGVIVLILDLQTLGNVDFDLLEECASYNIWHVNFINSVMGGNFGENISNLEGCFSLSNPINVNFSLTKEGTLSGGPYEFCVGDGNPDFIMTDDLTITGAVGTNMAWVITDENLTILDIPSSPLDVDFEDANGGICLIWHLSYEDDLTGAEVGMNAANLGGCFSLSNSISVTRNGVNGGTLMGGPYEFCVGDGNSDFIMTDDLTITGAVGSNMAWVITDENLTILDIPSSPLDVDFEGASGGTCLIWHLSYEDDLTGAEVGMNAENLGGCFSLSNSIPVIRNEVNGGTLAGGPYQFCVGDGNSDFIVTDDLTITGAIGTNMAWVITDENLTILDIPTSPLDVDFEEAGAGTCLIWHLSFEDNLIGAEVGMNAENLGGCFSLSNPISVIRNEVNGGTLAGGPYQFCVGDGIPDFITPDDLTLSDAVGSNSAWVITDNELNILGLPNSPEEVDFEQAGSGICLIWNVSFESGFSGAEVGLNAADLQGCFSLSNPIQVTRIEECCQSEPSCFTADVASLVNSNNAEADINAAALTIGSAVLTLQRQLTGTADFDENEINDSQTEGDIAIRLGVSSAVGAANSLKAIYSVSSVVCDLSIQIWDIDQTDEIILQGFSGGIAVPYTTNLGSCVSQSADVFTPNGSACEVQVSGNVNHSFEAVFDDCIDAFEITIYDQGAGNGGSYSLVIGEACEETIDPDGGVLMGGPYEFCVGDGIPDFITTDDLTLSDAVGSNSAWVITDDQLNILGLPNSPEEVDFEGAGLGTCLIWHLSFDGELIGAEVGANATYLIGCYDLSNPIAVVRNEVNGGTLIGGPYEFCVGDGNSDFIMTDDLTLAGNVGANSAWVITDNQLNILDLPNSPEEVDFEGAGSGICLIWHISFEGELIGAEVGANAADLIGCYDLSNSITVVRNEDCIDPCVEDLTIEGSINPNLYEASQTITSTGIVDQGMVEFSAGECINLEAGFEVNVNNVFHAFIEGCGDQ